MKKSYYILIAIIILIIILLGFFLYKPAKVENPKLKLAINTWVGYGPLYVAEEKGFFKNESLDVEISVIEDVSAKKSALKAGSLDSIGDLVDTLVLERDENVPAVAVMQFDVSDGADGIVTTNKINSVKDLKGKSIAVQKNFVGESFLLYVLKKNNMSEKDVKMIDMESGSAGAAFVAGKVDSAVTWEPWLSKAKERSDGKVLLTSKDEPGVIVDIFSVNENTLNTKSQDVKKFMRAWFRALDYIKSNPDESYAIMAKHYDMSAQDFQDMVSSLKWPDYNENLNYFNVEKNNNIYDVADTFSGLFLDSGKIKQPFKKDIAINNSLLKDLYN